MLDAASLVAAETAGASSGVGASGKAGATGAAGRSYFGASDMQPLNAMASARGVSTFFIFVI
jgi:hypothetical protein